MLNNRWTSKIHQTPIHIVFHNEPTPSMEHHRISIQHVHEGVASFHYGTLWTATELWNNVEHGRMKSCVMEPVWGIAGLIKQNDS